MIITVDGHTYDVTKLVVKQPSVRGGFYAEIVLGDDNIIYCPPGAQVQIEFFSQPESQAKQQEAINMGGYGNFKRHQELLTHIGIIERQLEGLTRLLVGFTRLYRQTEATEMGILDDVKTEVTSLTEASDAMEALLDKLHAKLQEALAAGDTAKAQEILDAVKAEKESIIEATLRNTEADPG